MFPDFHLEMAGANRGGVINNCIVNMSAIVKNLPEEKEKRIWTF